MSEVSDFIAGLNRKTIEKVYIEPSQDNELAISFGDGANELVISFGDGAHVSILDDGQQCCEHRYMTTDDDLSAFVGAELMDIEVRNGGSNELDFSDYDDIQFLLVTTSKGVFTIENHNEHNGYYGGFDVRIKFVDSLIIDAANTGHYGYATFGLEVE